MFKIFQITRDFVIATSAVALAIPFISPFMGNENITKTDVVAQTKTTYYQHSDKNIRCKQKYQLTKDFIEVLNFEEISNIYEQEDLVEDLTSYVDKTVPPNKTFKSYIDARHITDKTSEQFKLKSQYSLDYNTGIYMINGRYACALGSYYTEEIGTEFDVVMQSGNVIPCILADLKDDKHTDKYNQYTVANNSVVEFVVNEKVLIPLITTKWGNSGDVSLVDDLFVGEIDYIRIYE